MRIFDYRLYYRADHEYGNSLVKIEINDGSHWLSGNELREAYESSRPVDVGAMLRVGIRTLESYGMTNVERLLERKQVYLPGIVQSLDEMRNLGWDVLPYPRKFLPCDVNKCLASVKQAGIEIDASNIIRSDYTFETNGLAIKAAVDLLVDAGVPFNIYADWNLWKDLPSIGGQALYNYMMGFARVGMYNRVFTAHPDDPLCHGVADHLLLKWAARTGMHTLSRDEFDEFDLDYDFVLHGAEWGCPRLHKFRCEKGIFSIPDLGLSIEVPTSF